MGDVEEVLSSNLVKPSLQYDNEQTFDNDKSAASELNVYLDSTLELKPDESVSVERNLDTRAVKETAIEAGIYFTEKMDEAFLVEGVEGVMSKSFDSRDELVEQVIILEAVNEELPGEGVAKKSGDEMGDAIFAKLEMSMGVVGPITTSVVSHDHISASDLATSNEDAATDFHSVGLLDTAKGGGENMLSDMQVTISESALVVAGAVQELEVAGAVQELEVAGAVDDKLAAVEKLEVAGVEILEVAGIKSGIAEVLEISEVDKSEIAEVSEVAGDGMTWSVAVEEHEPLTRAEDDMLTMAMESLEEVGHQNGLVDPVEPSLALEGAENAVESAAGDFKTSVTASNSTEIGGAVLTVELKDAAAADVTVGQDAGTGYFPVLGPESIRVITEVEQDRRCAEGEIVIGDSENIEMLEPDPSKDLEMPGLELGGDESVVALKTKDLKDKMEEAGETLTDPQANKENKMETDERKDEEPVGKLHSLEVVADGNEDEEILIAEVTGLADTELETEADVGESVKATDTDMETETNDVDSGKAAGGKRKKGRMSLVPGNSKLASRAQKTTDEDVCFICFDGGDLFICDRRGCGKAYHPSCVDRDEAYFRAKGIWNCGWHLCSKCGKNARYMCYTCTFSLCKACIRDAVILCVRGSKGFCETCMRTVLLIENHASSNGDAKIDFDDKSSWEFLFKDYYTDLKSKHSLSFSEILAAKNPWKGSVGATIKEDSPEAAVGAYSNEGSGSDNHAENQEASNKPKRRKNKKRLRTLAKTRVSGSSDASVPDDDEGSSGPASREWASLELLEFVVHMRDGDTSPLTQYDVHSLLLEYIQRHKLRAPHRKSQIICDSRLEKLFGKPHVGHFEILKLLDSHFLVKDDSQADDGQGSVVDTETNLSEANENVETTPTKGLKDKKRKHKKGIGRGPQYSRYEFAAIDMHNIGLIYLRRKLMEDLLDDTNEFSNKVVGTFVRIRISGSMQKQDLYRLVLVVGTSQAAEPYKMGKRTTYTMLEILNLNKTEIVSIDSISNQDFTEEECNRLRQSIKCGLLNRMTVGDILDKAMELQEARVNDWLESEIMRLSHLRDRASDMGRKKQLRECVEKLQILKNPEERLRKLEEVPQVHEDPNMDPNHESEEDDSEHEDSRQVFMKTKISGFTRRGGVAISSRTDFSPRESWNENRYSIKNRNFDLPFSNRNSSKSEDDVFHGIDKDTSRNLNRDRDLPFSNRNSSKSEDVFHGIDKDTSRNLKRDREIVRDDYLSKLNSPPNHPIARSDKLLAVGSISIDSPLSVSSKQPQGVVSTVSPLTPLTPANEASAAVVKVNLTPAKEARAAVVKVNETQKMWHYKDPSGKIQGPFSIVQLRKWNNNGYFPTDLRIWKAGDKQDDDSLLLTDALAGKYPEELPPSDGRSVQSSNPIDSSVVKRSLAIEELKHIASDLSHLPSPTPNRRGRKREEELAGGGANPSLGPVSTQNSTDFRNYRPESVQTPTTGEQNIMFSTLSGKVDAIEKQSDTPVNTTLPIQGVNGQDPHGGTPNRVETASQKMDTNLPLPVTPISYDQRVQNPNTSFSNSGLVLPQENWRPPPMQVVDQSSNHMQPVPPNLAWGNSSNSVAPALISGNPNMGWGPPPTMPGGAMNGGGWVGPVPPQLPQPLPTNMNWGAVNANPAWFMANMNLALSVQGPNMGNMNPGWFGPPPPPTAGNMMSVPGLMPAMMPSGWVPPVTNMVSAVQQPQLAPVNGWAMPPTSNPIGAPPTAQGSAPPVNSANQGWGGQNRGGDQYSSEMNQGYQGGGGYGSSSLSFGRGGGGPGGGSGPGSGSGSGSSKRRWCPYNNNGRCRKGATCYYRHA